MAGYDVKAWLIVLLIVVAGVAWSQDWLRPARWREVVSQPEVVYRWKDERGQWAYGTQPPAGKKAERVRAEDKMSVVEAPAVKPVSAPDPAASNIEEMRRKMMDKAVDGQ